ncbi:MAG: hypothetical protein ACRYG7_46290 [Janthinobacterium lividum]
MYTLNLWGVAVGLLALTTLTQCTPPQSPNAITEWVVTNQTPDTLWVTVRYPLDSVALSAAAIVETRRQLRLDSADQLHQSGFYQPSLRQVAHARGQWYLVQNSTGDVVYQADHDPGPTESPRVNRVRGELTYRVPPHGTQHLLQTYAKPTVQWPQAPFTAVYLRQGPARRVVLPGPSLLAVFRPQPTGQEHNYSPRYRCQLTVGPGLTIIN